MQIQTIEYDKDKARAKYESYREQLKTAHDDETDMLRRAYLEASRGHKLLELGSVMRHVGVDGQLRPKIAIARAGMPWVWYRHRSYDNLPQFTTKKLPHGSDSGDYSYIYYRTRIHNVDWPKTKDEYKAQVPVVPAEFRPKAKLTNYHVLFEPVWERVPPHDPVLLKHIGGTLYVVLAQWDLTEIERAVMAQAFI